MNNYIPCKCGGQMFRTSKRCISCRGREDEEAVSTPTEAEIRQRSLAIQAGWDEREEMAHRVIKQRAVEFRTASGGAMKDLTDDELLRFVAEFAGWENGTGRVVGLVKKPDGSGYVMPCNIPNYLGSVDAFIRDVVPKMIQMKLEKRIEFSVCLGRVIEDRTEVGPRSEEGHGYDGCLVTNFAGLWNATSIATAHDRCLALYRACGGKQPAK